jgi:hypothetical protein
MGSGNLASFSLSYWREDELVESTKLPVGDHCRMVAGHMGVSGPGREAIVKELRTIACQAKKMAEKSDMKKGHAYRNLMKAIERLGMLASVLEDGG